MNCAADVVKRLRLARFIDNDIGLIERLMQVKRNSEEIELIFVLNIRVVAYPRGVELPRKQHPVIFLVGPPLNELDHRPNRSAR